MSQGRSRSLSVQTAPRHLWTLILKRAVVDGADPLVAALVDAEEFPGLHEEGMIQLVEGFLRRGQREFQVVAECVRRGASRQHGSVVLAHAAELLDPLGRQAGQERNARLNRSV